MLRLGIAQINTTVGDFSGNAARIIDFIHRAKEKNVDLLVFPEMTVCGYPPEDLLYKKDFIQENLKTLRSLKKQARGISLLVGGVDQDAQGLLYNAAVFLHEGKISGIYHKECLPNYGVFDEKRYFTPGQHNPVFRLGPYRIGVNICEDIWFDDGVAQQQAALGAGVLINISASPYDIGKIKMRRSLLARRAKEAKAFVCYANLIGGQDEMVFDGASCIFDPKGRCVAAARYFEEDLLIADLDIPEIKKRISRREILMDFQMKERVPVALEKMEMPGKTEQAYQALVLGVRDYVRKNHFQKVVIGLSGGVDSSLVAAVAVDALGKENVIGVTMPSRYNSPETRSDAGTLAQNLGIELLEVPIQSVFESYLERLKESFGNLPSGLAEENLQARIRGNILMGLSNKHGWLVLTTGNKSEMAVGYCTLYGDMSGGFAVIKDVYKTTVYELVKYRNTLNGRPLIPETVISRAPSAELRENQKDQDSLPPYDLLDRILIEYIEQHQGLAGIVKKVGQPDVVGKVLRLVDNSEYKRRQAPPGVKITPRAFGKDWRFPITNGYKQ